MIQAKGEVEGKERGILILKTSHVLQIGGSGGISQSPGRTTNEVGAGAASHSLTNLARPGTSPRSPGRCAASLRRESLLRPPPAAQPLLALPLLPKVPLSLASALAEGGGPSSGAGEPLPTARP